MTTVDNQIEKVLESSGLAEVGRSDLVKTFGPEFVKVRGLLDQSAAIIVTDATQVSEMKAARTARLQIKAARVGVEKLRKETKDEALRFGQSVDKVAKMISAQCEAEETRLEEAETFAERAEAKRKDMLEVARREALSALVPDVTIYPVRDMTEAAWGQLLAGMQAAKRAAEEAAAKAEDARIREENARLAREAQEREAAAKAERERAAAELKAEQDKARAAIVAAEEAARVAAERARKEREAIEAKAKSERDAAEAKARAERERLEADARREREAREAVERKARAEREAAEKVRQEEADRLQHLAELAAEEEARKAAAPDADKIEAVARQISAIELPDMATERGSKAKVLVKREIAAIVKKILAVANELKV